MIPIIKNIQLEDGEEIKPIDDCPNYFITSYGRVVSTVKGTPRFLSPFLDTKKRYWLIRINNHRYLLHRIVAKHFVPNPNNLPEVNHRDKNPQNPKAENLEWCTRKDNLNDSYSTMSPTRNFRTCKLYEKETLLGVFQSIAKASRYAKKHYGASENSLIKYLRWGDLRIIPDNPTGKYSYPSYSFKMTQDRAPIRIYKNEYLVKTVKNYKEASEFLETTLGHPFLPSTLQYRCKHSISFEGYLIKRN